MEALVRLKDNYFVFLMNSQLQQGLPKEEETWM